MWFKKKQEPLVAGLPENVLEDGKIDIYSMTWRYVEAWAENELDTARKRNDSVNLDRDTTAVLRGKIKAFKGLINLPKEKGILNK